MRIAISAALLLALALLIARPVPALADNVILTVKHNASGTNEFPTIQGAVQFAGRQQSNPANTSSFTVVVQADPVPYTGPVTPVSNVPIVGTSTAGTFVTGSGSGAVFTLDGVSGVTIRNLTFRIGAAAGISVTNGTGIDIRNNVFEMGSAATAVQIQSSASTLVVNNTFFGNGTALNTNSPDTTISNDIFSSNNVAIQAQVTLNGLSYNDYFNNASNGVSDLGPHSIPSPVIPNPDPRFVAPLSHDFHLRSDSPAKNSGNPQFRNSFDAATSDMGAYGGPYADTTLLPVTGLTSALLPPSSVLLKWEPTTDGSVTFYCVYLGSSATDLHEVQAAAPPVPVPVGTTSALLATGEVPTPAVPAAPRLVAITPSDQALKVSWTAVPGATGYRVFYSSQSITADSASTASTALVGADKTSFTIGGLRNGTTYFVRVAALAQAQLFFAVTAVKDIGVPSNPGSSNESPLSQVVAQGIGPLQTGGLSNELSDFPEAVTPFPNLRGGGCFIATAAYGFYSAPQVQALRIFRDRYLMTCAPGRDFVAWYYRVGPRGARYLNDHPWLKPPVRLLLLPLVLMSMFLLYTSPLCKVTFLLAGAAALLLAHRRRERKPWVEMGGTL
jgi:hypothetical protein